MSGSDDVKAISGNLHWLIRSYLQKHPIVHVYCAPLDVTFSNYDVVEPDLGESFGRAEELSCEANESLTTQLLPGLVMPLTAVFKQ